MTPLRQKMTEALELRGVSPKTVKLYVDCVARFARHYGKSPEHLGREEVRNYLLHLIHERKVAWGTYKQALAALRYLYRWVLEQGELVEDIRAPRPERRRAGQAPRRGQPGRCACQGGRADAGLPGLPLNARRLHA